MQLAGFRQAKVRDEFIEQYQNSVELHSYQRIQSGQPYWVVTTVAYLTREEALASISQLPEQLKSRSPWVKSIASINSEQVMEESRIN